MKLLRILTEGDTGLTESIPYSPRDFTKLKRSLKEKFNDSDDTELPPLAIDIYDDVDRGTTVIGYFSEDAPIFKYYEDEQILEYNPEEVSKEEVESFTSMI